MSEALALYVHWPFCQAKCPYCDFNSHVSAGVDHDRWRAAMVSRVHHYAALLPDRRLTSIFFGGGTPSLMDAKTVAAIIDAATGCWTAAPDIEITLEANPTSVEAARFADYASAGVNRASVGVQALNDADLRALGRLHSADEAMRALEIAKAAFGRVSFDLIYARQDQSLAAWEQELGRALAVGTNHLSLYQLTIEPGTAFGARFQRGTLRGLPDEDLSADMYLLTQEMTRAAGLPRYEVSNHARPGFESQHNLTYWRGGDWVGVGPGAHGRFTVEGERIATEAVLNPNQWLAAVEKGEADPSARVEREEEDEIRLMMGLRLVEGFPTKCIDIYLDIKRLEGDGLLWQRGDRIGATESGALLLNHVISKLLA